MDPLREDASVTDLTRRRRVPAPSAMSKYLLTYSKLEPVRWLGHLDTLRAFERAIRRAQIPVAFTNGFNPRERLAFASALGTGITGEAERLTMDLVEDLPLEEVTGRLNEALPPGIRIVAAEAVPDAGAKDMLNRFDRAEYLATVTCPDTARPALAQALTDLMARESAPVNREKEGRVKVVDIRPKLFSLDLEPGESEPDRFVIRMVIGQGEGGNVRPAEVVAALAQSLPGLMPQKLHRVKLF